MAFALSVMLAAGAGVAFSNWIGSVSDSPDGTEAVTSDDGRVTPVTSRPAPSTTEPPPTTTAAAATTTPEPPSAATLDPVP